MNTNKKNLLFYTNNNKCVSLPQKDDCDYLRISNYLSEYLTELEKLQVLDNLGITSRLEDVYKSLNNKFNLYATLEFLDEYYVKKIDLYYPEDEDDDDGFEPIVGPGTGNNGSSWNVDDFLSLTSINPVQNRIITAALNEKADISSLENYVTLSNLSNYLSQYQRYLTAGTGIVIDRTTNTISTSLDLNPFIFVDELPTTGDPNKLYLVPDKNNAGYYIQYNYNPTERRWVEIGRVSLGSIMSGYLTQEQADARYIKKGEIDPSSTTINITVIKELLKDYVKKSEVYTPDLYNSSDYSQGISDGDFDWSTIINGGGGSGTGSIVIDKYLDVTSPRAVANSAITAALNTKLDKLKAGSGISISDDGTITCTFDTKLYVFVRGDLPLISQADPNKIYLKERADGVSYQVYVVENGSWKYKGIQNLGAGIDLSDYLTKTSASDLYITKSYFLTYMSEYTPSNPGTGTGTGTGTVVDLSNYATKAYVDGLFGNLNQETLDKLLQLLEALDGDGNFSEITLALAEYAKLSDVYNRTYLDNKFQAIETGYLTNNSFNSLWTLLNNKIDRFTVDTQLSRTSENPVLNKAVYAKFQEMLSSEDAAELYVKKTDLSGYTTLITLKTLNGESLLGSGNITIAIPTVDSTVTLDGINAVSSRGIYSYITEVLETKQNLLTAGTGIYIDGNNKISVNLDLMNPFVIVDTRPNSGLLNKIYLVKEGNSYTLYIYSGGEWLNKGTIDFNIDLTDYLKIADANFAAPSDLTTLRNWVESTFLKKEDIYTPDQGDTLSGVVVTPSTPGSGSGSGSTDPVNVSAYYESSMNDGVTTTVAVGNISSGTNVSSLKGLTFSQLFDRIFFSETWNNPNYAHTISMTIPVQIVKVGTQMTAPAIVANWNPNILPESDILTQLKVRQPNSQTDLNFVSGQTYDTLGLYTFTLSYSYPAGSYNITSNYGNSKTIQVNGSQGNITKYVKTAYPWYINSSEQAKLVPNNESYTTEINLSGSPIIKIPGNLSTCTILADLGLGYMNVDWTRTTETINGITYSVWTKPDSYLQEVRHKITFTVIV